MSVCIFFFFHHQFKHCLILLDKKTCTIAVIVDSVDITVLPISKPFVTVDLVATLSGEGFQNKYMPIVANKTTNITRPKSRLTILNLDAFTDIAEQSVVMLRLILPKVEDILLKCTEV